MSQPANGRLTDVERTTAGTFAFTYWNANDLEDLWLVFDQERDARLAHKMMSDVIARARLILPV